MSTGGAAGANVKTAAFVDIDGTLHDGFTTPEFIVHLNQQGAIDQHRFGRFATLYWHDQRRSHAYRSWAQDVTDAVNALLVGHDEISLETHLRSYALTVKSRLYPFALPLITMLKDHVDDVVLITGSHQFIAHLVGDAVGIDRLQICGTRLHRNENGFTNEFVEGFAAEGADKRRQILDMDYDLSASVAIGDSISDLAMFETVATSILMRDEHTPAALLDEVARMHIHDIDKTLPVAELVTAVCLLLPLGSEANRLRSSAGPLRG